MSRFLPLNAYVERRRAFQSQAAASSQGLPQHRPRHLYSFTLGSLVVLIGMIVLPLCYALILINIAGSLAILAMNLVLGPVFFALSFDRDFRGRAQQWFRGNPG